MTLKATIRGKADIIFFQKYTGECCEVCGSYNVDPAHHFFFKGQYEHLRYEPDNAITLCTDCHSKLHHGGLRIEIETEIIRIRGQEWYCRLLEKANKNMGSSWKTEEWYRNEYNKLK